MGKSPAAIIIARHGARLDAADKNWHLTSPTPYDPPLSYGGWLQSRALGVRIINLLNSPDDPVQSPQSDRGSANTTPYTSTRASPEPDQAPERKRRVIIHTSPYLRCLQTAIAVSSGISQYHSPPECATIGDSASRDVNSNGTASSPDTHRSLLRVDAFLGEWLCRDYFEDITPPPCSERLIGDAKAELLRRNGNAVPEADVSTGPSTGNFPGGWGSFSSPGSPDPEEKEKLGPLLGADAIKTRYRAGSYDSLYSLNNSRSKAFLSRINTNLSSIPDGGPGSYVPPTPSYAIASSDPIPAGYVTHARNACVNVDYQWDSMRESQNWGNGGNYGEEWSAMHSRFRHGLGSMVEWYEDHDTMLTNQSCNGTSEKPLAGNGEYDGDDGVETILVLITHGAGCNAMVGALTGEPVLLDFNTASLTMAVRKDNTPGGIEVDGVHDAKRRRRSTSDPSPLHNFHLKLAASVDHLRPPAPPSQNGLSMLPSPASSRSASISSHRHRTTSRPSLSQAQFIIGPSPALSTSSQNWTNGRPSTAPRGGTGLWGSQGDGGSESDELVPNFGGPVSSSASANGMDSDSGNERKAEGLSSNGSQPSLPRRTLSQRGLWGSAPLNAEREGGGRRRWTVSERRV